MRILINIINKIKKKGFSWFFARLKREFRSPTIHFLQVPINFFLTLRRKILRHFNELENKDLLYGIYDLDVSPVTFNFVEFLIDVEYEARLLGKKGFVIVFVPSSNNPHLRWEEYESVIDSHSTLWRFQNILLPLTFLAPKCHGTFILPSRSDAVTISKNHEVYPHLSDGVNLRAIDIVDFYRKLDKQGLFDGLRASKQGANYVSAWLSANKIYKPIVTITIRSSKFDTPRNSNLEAWSKFAHYLMSSGYHPIIIPDTDDAFRELRDFIGICHFTDCVWNIGLRMAIYEAAYVNFFVPNGCGALAVFNPRCSYIQLNLLPVGSIVTTEESYKRIGHEIGTHYKFANQKQRLSFKPDNYDNILYEFNLFVSDHPVIASASQNFDGEL